MVTSVHSYSVNCERYSTHSISSCQVETQTSHLSRQQQHVDGRVRVEPGHHGVTTTRRYGAVQSQVRHRWHVCPEATIVSVCNTKLTLNAHIQTNKLADIKSQIYNCLMYKQVRKSNWQLLTWGDRSQQCRAWLWSDRRRGLCGDWQLSPLCCLQLCGRFRSLQHKFLSMLEVRGVTHCTVIWK